MGFSNKPFIILNPSFLLIKKIIKKTIRSEDLKRDFIIVSPDSNGA